jgi:DNA-directed RNA polymerase specialized sigma24 family protein
MAKKRRTKNYLNNPDIIEQWKLSAEQDAMNDEFSKMMMLLTRKYSSKMRFNVCDSFREDMESFALMTVSRVWRSFNPEKSDNPFAYFTQVIKRAFYQFQNQERRQRDIGNELLVDKGHDPSHAFMVEYEFRDYDPGEVGGDITIIDGEGSILEVIDASEYIETREAEKED